MIRLSVKADPGGAARGGTLTVERVPVMGDYIAPRGNELVQVRAVVLTPNGPEAADVFAIHDPDNFPDELK